jgi:hypothetical protein
MVVLEERYVQVCMCRYLDRIKDGSRHGGDIVMRVE